MSILINNNQKITETINFAALVQNSKTTLSLELQDKMVQLMNEEFTEKQQKWYVANLYMFLHYDANKDYLINLEDVYKMIGFANKANAKRTLKNNFTLNEGYKISLIQKDDKVHGGHNEEHIIMNIKTFKRLCMLAKTKQGAEIRDYYLKLEDINNELIKEELNQKTLLLQQEQENSKKLLEEKDKYIAQLKDQEYVSILYIAHNPVIKNVHKIGISSNTKSNDILVRGENHKSSNPQFEFLFTFETPNAKLIEDVVKLLLKPFKLQKPEWFAISYNRMKQIVDFAIMMYENYHINDSVDNLCEFISRYRSNRLINTNKARVLIERNIYELYVQENVILSQGLKVSTELIADDFHIWYQEKYPDKIESSHIKLATGNYSTEFRKELITNISSITDIEYSSKLSYSNKKRGIHFSNCGGFPNMEVKSMSKKVIFFDETIYEKYVKDFITVTKNPRHKVARVELIEHFLIWIKENNYTCKSRIMCRTAISEIFKTDLCEAIEEITGIALLDVCKINYHGCFVGFTHSYYPFIGKESSPREAVTDYENIEIQIDKWIEPTNNTSISIIFRTILDNGFILDSKIKDILKTSYCDITLNRKKHKWYLVFKRDKNTYTLTDDSLQYYNDNYIEEITDE